jgi:hypothetical protein
VPSSRRIGQRLHEDIAFRVLAANNTPDFRTISDFRKDNLGALGNLFLQVLQLCQRAGLVKLGHVSLDGTKVKANASKHQAMSYGKMKEEEAHLAAKVERLLKEAQEADEGEDQRGDELPQELAFGESRLKKIREAKVALEEAKEQAQAQGKDHSGVPEEKAQRNFTDPDSRIMPAPWGQGVPPGLQLPSGGGQRPSGDRGRRCHQPAFGPDPSPTPGKGDRDQHWLPAQRGVR